MKEQCLRDFIVSTLVSSKSIYGKQQHEFSMIQIASQSSKDTTPTSNIFIYIRCFVTADNIISYLNMSQKLPILDGLTLQNFEQKVGLLRGGMRYAINKDIQQIRSKMNKYKQSMEQHDEDNSYEQDGQHQDDSQEERQAARQKQLSEKQSQLYANGQHLEQQPEYQDQYLNMQIAESQINYQAVRQLWANKISVDRWGEYIRCVLSIQMWDRLRQVYDQLLDLDQKVDIKKYIGKVNKMGVGYSQAIAVEVPLIARKITLKKVLFDLGIKSQKLGAKMSLDDIVDHIEHYINPAQPTIDYYMAKMNPKTNYFNIPNDMVEQLKNIFRRSISDQFLSYCATRVLLSKVKYSGVFRGRLGMAARPKTNQLPQKTILQVIQYMRNKAPQYLDIDQFLLYFTCKGFTFYPILQKQVGTKQYSLLCNDNRPKPIPKSPKAGSAGYRQPVQQVDGYLLSMNNPNSIRNQKLKQMLQKNKQEQEQQNHYKFKARPVPKSISQEKYMEFRNVMQSNMQTQRAQKTARMKSQQAVLNRLKSNTKLFDQPKRQPVIMQEYQITSRPAPQSTHYPTLQQIQGQKTSRRQKILSTTCLKYQKDWQQLPLVANMQPAVPVTAPRLKIKSFARDVPDYKPQQLRMQTQLLQRKQRNIPTEPQQFFFCTAKRHQHICFRSHSPPQRTSYYHDEYKKILEGPEPQIYYTTKFNDMMRANKVKAVQRERSANKKLEEDLERYKKHANFAKFMKKNLAKIPDYAQINQNQAKDKIDRHKKYWKNLDRQHQQHLNQMYGRVLQRPFLYQQQTVSAHNINKYIRQNNDDVKPKKNRKKKAQAKRKLYEGESDMSF